MRKYILSALIAVGMCLFIPVRPVNAVGVSGLSIRLEQPKTPTNQNSFGIVFVALDLAKRDVTVTCQKQGPSDGGFVTFGGVQTFPNGGNTGTCTVDSSILTTAGTYTFKTVASANGNTAEDSVTVQYNTEGPGDPRDYGKSKPSACEYKIHFKTADDSGKTVKVEIYRSEDTSFTANSGTRVSTVAIGSNTEHDETISGTCDKTYYFAVRAFDSSGNGSNVVGDSETHVTVTQKTSTTTTTSTGGTTIETIALGAQEVLGAGGLTEEGAGESEEGTALGETTGQPEPEHITLPLEGQVKGAKTSIFRSWLFWTCAILGGAAILFWYASKKIRQEHSSPRK